jgi:hypothetical protein
VFIDIHEVEDIPDRPGRWARLNHDLGGKGTADPEAAINEIFLGELYYSFNELLKPERVDTLQEFFTKNKADGEGGIQKELDGFLLSKFIDSFIEPVKAFTSTAAFYIKGADGRYDPWVAEPVSPAEDIPVLTPGLDPEKTAQIFRSYLERLAGMAAYTTRGNTGKFIGELAAAICEKREFALFALGYGILSLLRSVIGEGASGADGWSLVNHWQIDRKLRETFQSRGINREEARQVMELIKAVLCRTAPRPVPDRPVQKTADSLALAIFIDNYDAEDFRRLLGINRYDDITWYNKEKFADALFYGSFFLLLEDDAAFGKSAPSWTERAALITGVRNTLINADKTSGYKLDLLLAALTPAPVKPAAKPRRTTKK